MEDGCGYGWVGGGGGFRAQLHCAALWELSSPSWFTVGVGVGVGNQGVLGLQSVHCSKVLEARLCAYAHPRAGAHTVDAGECWDYSICQKDQ